MKKFFDILIHTIFSCLVVCGIFYGSAHAEVCAQSQIDIGNGNCTDAKFTVTTTNLSANTTFAFYMSATGTFYVDWGDDTVDTIVRTNTNETLYSHTYTSGGVKTIKFSGLATGYNTDKSSYYRSVAAIRFSTTSLMSAIDGSIGQIFPTLGTADENQPTFYQTFMYSQITSIPENLFNGITSGTNAMFLYTFTSCTKLTSIPENLFTGITGGKYKLFSDTFRSCTSLTSIPENLFKDVIYSAGDEFFETFYGCNSLQKIPKNLFANIKNFTDCHYMFYQTFSNCSALQNIPDGLFANIPSTARNKSNMFVGTFCNCTHLTGYIPATLFAGLNNSGVYEDLMMYNIFANTNLDTTCPAGTTQYTTGYEDYWDGHVSCVDSYLHCDAGNYLPAHGYECVECPINNYCSGGTCNYSESVNNGITQCPNNLYSPRGSYSVDQCGRILHLGDNTMYLRSVKKTVPSLNIDIDNDGTPDFFGNMTTQDVVMNADTERKLQVQYNGLTYFVHDDTVNVQE